MNWYKKLKFEEVSGEYWIDDSGMSMYADGDIGDYNHEAYVIETVRNQIMEDEEDWDEWKKKTAQEKFEQEMDAVRGIPEEEHRVQEEFKKTPEEFLFKELRERGISDEDYAITEGFGDAREYAMKKWGWKRLQGDNVESWTLTKWDLETIARGLWEAYDEEAEKETYNLYIYGTGKWYSDIPYDLIENGNVKDILEFDTRISGYGKNNKDVKIAFPILKKRDPTDYRAPPGKEYRHFFHEGFYTRDLAPKSVIIWFVDANYKLHQIRSTTDTGHTDWDEFNQLYNLSSENILAAGRYSKEMGEATMSLPYFLIQKPYRYKYIRSRIERILDKVFDNPIIQETL